MEACWKSTELSGAVLMAAALLVGKGVLDEQPL